mmetsp:Transcript_130456/g.365000  ORF Transcript_130456/g.365000 Transcript_130456/m.365000 type:complete len:257 (+) Transcript_130456:584-1354(+)
MSNVLEWHVGVPHVHLQQWDSASTPARLREGREEVRMHAPRLVLRLAALDVEDGLNAPRQAVNEGLRIHYDLVVARVAVRLQLQDPLKVGSGPSAIGVHVVRDGGVELAPLGAAARQATFLPRLAILALGPTIRRVRAEDLRDIRRKDEAWVVHGVHADPAPLVHHLCVHNGRGEPVIEARAPARAAPTCLRAWHPCLPISIHTVVKLVDDEARRLEVAGGVAPREAGVDALNHLRLSQEVRMLQQHPGECDFGSM